MEAMKRMNLGLDVFFQFLYPLLFAYLAYNAWALGGRPGFSENARLLYSLGALLNAFFFTLSITSLFKKLNPNFNDHGLLAFFAAESAPHRILSWNPLVRIIVHITWIGLIGMLIVGSAGLIQGWPVPAEEWVFTADNLAITTGERVMFQAIHPALTEDGAFLVINNIIIGVFTLLMWFILKIDIKTPLKFTVTVAVTSLIVSLGYGAIVTGFASTHYAVQGTNVAFYISATAFQWITQMLYQLTGLFLPLAHMTNNLLFTFSYAIGITIAGPALCALLPEKILKRWSQ